MCIFVIHLQQETPGRGSLLQGPPQGPRAPPHPAETHRAQKGSGPHQHWQRPSFIWGHAGHGQHRLPVQPACLLSRLPVNTQLRRNCRWSSACGRVAGDATLHFFSGCVILDRSGSACKWRCVHNRTHMFLPLHYRVQTFNNEHLNRSHSAKQHCPEMNESAQDWCCFLAKTRLQMVLYHNIWFLKMICFLLWKATPWIRVTNWLSSWRVGSIYKAKNSTKVCNKSIQLK